MGIVAIDGFNLAVSAVTILRLLPEEKDEHKNNLNAGICLIIYGCGNSIAGYFGGRLCDKYLIKKTMTGNLVIYCTSCLVSLAGWYVREFWLAAVGCFLWGSCSGFDDGWIDGGLLEDLRWPLLVLRSGQAVPLYLLPCLPGGDDVDRQCDPSVLHYDVLVIVGDSGLLWPVEDAK